MAASGLRAAKSVNDAVAGADAVFTILTTPAVVETVWLGPDGLFATAPRTAILMQMSTIGPALTRGSARRPRAGASSFLETPISGTSTAVTKGGGTIFVGGDAALVATCRRCSMRSRGRPSTSAAIGAGAVAKLAANLMGGINAIALAEALVLGAKAGVEPAKLLDALQQSPVRRA